MRLPLLLMLPVIIISVLIDWLIWRFLANSRYKYPWAYIHRGVSIALIGIIACVTVSPVKEVSGGLLAAISWYLYAFLSIYIGKMLYVLMHLLSLIPRLFKHNPWTWLSKTGIVLGVIAFGMMWWGVFNRTILQVTHVTVTVPQLPDGLQGMKIVQISDLHVGSWGNDTTYISNLVDTVNSLHPDLIVFTGDIVNRRSDELLPHASVLARLSAPLGVYSIMGNHDYGDYSEWPDMKAKQANRQMLLDLQKDMGWKMLNNAHDLIYHNGDTLCLIGVENVGDPPFHTYGNIDAAYPNLNDGRFKVLLSHNPAHWHKDIQNNPKINIPLTLSGHTHAMQIELGGVSPAALRYKEWGGLYADSTATHNLYVNIGAGTVGIPARIGANPEITLITLKK